MVNSITFRKYLVDVFNFIDYLFTIALICFFILWCSGHEVETYKWGISIIGVLLWPSKKLWAKWLHVNTDDSGLTFEFKKGE